MLRKSPNSLKSAMDARANAVTAGEAALKLGQDKLKADQAALNARLESMKMTI